MEPVVASSALSDVPMNCATKPVPDQEKRGLAGSLVSTRPNQRTPEATTPADVGGAPASASAPDPASPPAPVPAAPPVPEPSACSPDDDPQAMAEAAKAVTAAMTRREARVDF